MPDQIPSLPAMTPLALSAEHHFLRVLSLGEPVTRAEALTRICRRFPDYTALGPPERPTTAAQRAWESLISEGWCRYVQFGSKHGQVLTGRGETRLETLHRQQVWLPYLKQVEADFGADAARTLEASYR